uniref:Uncharacterized protein n=1 Tax=Macaca mulatta TaxID=9544 RepID=A0A5F7ZKI7_MACMU
GSKQELFSFLRHCLDLSLRLEYSGTISAHCNIRLPGSSNPPASVSGVGRVTGVHHHTSLIFVFLVETGFHHVGQAGPKLLTSFDLSASSQNAGITGVTHHAQPRTFIRASILPSWPMWEFVELFIKQISSVNRNLSWKELFAQES